MKIFSEGKELNRNEKLLIAILVVNIIMCIFNLSFLNSIRMVNYQLKSDETLVAGSSLQVFCQSTFKNILEKKFSINALDDLVYKTLLNDPDYFEFSENERIEEVVAKKDQCRVVTNGEDGVRAFLITTESSFENPLFNRVTNINEEGVN